MVSNLPQLRRLIDILMRYNLALYLISGVVDAALIMNPARKSIKQF
jgi:hypothetical protein